jgi:hypothetical protein
LEELVTDSQIVKKLTLTLCAMAALASAAFAGPEYSGKETKQVAPPPCPQWYADNEFNVDLWGTYLFTGTDSANDKYVESDHAWGGGMDVKYFFRRYFGVGIEGYVVDSARTRTSLLRLGDTGGNSRAIGSVLGTFTLRYPLPCSRFAPYVFAGGGAIFGGGERDRLAVTGQGTDEFGERFQILGPSHEGSRTEAIGQFGGGIEIRITPHIGWMNDFSWNVVDGPENNFGLVRSGVTFAF